jgi:hypothetical protein
LDVDEKEEGKRNTQQARELRNAHSPASNEELSR